ncbi:MAG: O-antigen ligase family protein [Paenibacillus lautus]|jgi:O-antigen ligase|uniref:O-antigen ligase family protein n=1 Tax=Paenibacillus lautus TaxID=1401 RepID=UPI0026ECB858|nr:O-antigen ligase family protein [Paenibacillus lautus]MCI1773933.1 O-antigen ligase family protein [Paenibacillus lautus]
MSDTLIQIIKLRNKFLLLCALIVMAALIGFFTPSHYELMIQLGCLLVAFIPAFIMSLKDHTLLLPYIVGCWIFSPEIRRIIDWLLGEFHSFSLVLMLPHVVTLTLIFSIINNSKNRSLKQELHRNKFYIYILISYIYAAIIGVAFNKVAGIYDLIGYFAPALIFLYLFFRPFNQHDLNKMINILVGYALIVSLYGWFQYLTLPAWDQFWIENANMKSIGKPEPLEFRMFSTMNSQGPVAVFLSTILVLMIVNKKWRRPIGWLGILIITTALMITLVRSAWVTLVIGLISYILFMEKGKKLGKIISIVIVGFSLFFIMSKLPGAENVSSRFETFQNIQEDHSFQERIQLIISATPQILSNPIGGGFGSIGRSTILGDNEAFAGLISVDNGYLGVFSTFGVIGGMLFFIGIFMLFRKVIQQKANEYRALAISTIIQLLASYMFGGGLQGYQAVLFWLFVSMVLAKDNVGNIHSVGATYWRGDLEEKSSNYKSRC